MATDTGLRLKLLIDRKAERVLLAEASKEVVDFLFSYLALPVATVVKFVGKDAMVGCVGSFYASVKKLDSAYMQPGAAKAFYGCRNGCPSYFTDVSGTSCPSCGYHMTNVLKYASPASGVTDRKRKKVQNIPTGAEKGMVTYTVMDNLTVSPMSAISSITVLSTIAVTHIGNLQEKTVQLGYKEGFAILKASLESRTVLTDVFLGKKRAPCPAR